MDDSPELSNSDIQTQIKVIFDKALDLNDTQLFHKLVESTLIPGITKLADIIKYERKDEIIKKAINDNLDSIEINEKPVAELLFGCRHPESKSLSWDRAYVVVKLKNMLEITFALFNNGEDSVNKTRNIDEAFNNYDNYIDKGWVPMTIEDLREISGTEIDNETLIEPIHISKQISYPKPNLHQNKFGFLRCISMNILFAFLLKYLLR